MSERVAESVRIVPQRPRGVDRHPAGEKERHRDGLPGPVASGTDRHPAGEKDRHRNGLPGPATRWRATRHQPPSGGRERET